MGHRKCDMKVIATSMHVDATMIHVSETFIPVSAKVRIMANGIRSVTTRM